MHELLDGGGVRAHHAEHELDVDRRVEQVLAEQVLYVVEVPDVVGFELRLRAGLAEHGADLLHVGEGVAEDVVAGVLQVVYLPLLEVSAPLGDGEEAEVEAARVERRHLGLQLGQDGGPFFQRHPFTAAGGRLHDHIAPVFDPSDNLAKEPDVRARLPRLRLAHVQVDDGRPGLVRPDGGVHDLLRRNRNGLALPWHRHPARNSRADDELLHACSLR